MHANEIVVRVVEGDRRFQIRQLLAECQRQTSESLALHTNADYCRKWVTIDPEACAAVPLAPSLSTYNVRDRLGRIPASLTPV
jgi:hypothetical protein